MRKIERCSPIFSGHRGYRLLNLKTGRRSYRLRLNEELTSLSASVVARRLGQ